MRSRGPEMTRVGLLPDHPLINYGLYTLQRTTEAYMRNSNNLVVARNELLRSIAEKEEFINNYRARKPTMTDVVKLYWHHEEALIALIGSGLVVRTHPKRNMLDVIMIRIRSFCWKLLRHKTYGYDMLSLVFLEIPFVANDVTYLWGYYLVDGIYPELATVVKTIPEPSDDDYKRIRYKKMQELARKDVEQAFGVIKKKWALLANPT
ncbi:ALP1-like protein [Tanacetum coccineum]